MLPGQISYGNTGFMLVQYRDDLLIAESFSLHLGPPKVYFIGKSHLKYGSAFGG
jgi:hypothetical protein